MRTWSTSTSVLHTGHCLLRPPSSHLSMHSRWKECKQGSVRRTSLSAYSLRHTRHETCSSEASWLAESAPLRGRTPRVTSQPKALLESRRAPPLKHPHGQVRELCRHRCLGVATCVMRVDDDELPQSIDLHSERCVEKSTASEWRAALSHRCHPSASLVSSRGGCGHGKPAGLARRGSRRARVFGRQGLASGGQNANG